MAGRRPRGALRPAEPAPARRPPNQRARREAGRRPGRRGGAARRGRAGGFAVGAGAARLQRLEALRRECVTLAEGTVGCGRPADQEPGVPGEGRTAVPAPAAASGAARARPGVAREPPPASFIPAAPPPFPSSGGESEVSARPVSGGGRGPRPRLPGRASRPAGLAPRQPRTRGPAPAPPRAGGDADHELRAAPRTRARRRPTPATRARGARPAASDWPAPPRGVWRAPGAPASAPAPPFCVRECLLLPPPADARSPAAACCAPSTPLPSHLSHLEPVRPDRSPRRGGSGPGGWWGGSVWTRVQPRML